MTREVPQQHCCIFHPRVKSLKEFIVKDTKEDKLFRYGLCFQCVHKLNTKESFKKLISERLEELAEMLQKQEEKKNG